MAGHVVRHDHARVTHLAQRAGHLHHVQIAFIGIEHPRAAGTSTNGSAIKRRRPSTGRISGRGFTARMVSCTAAPAPPTTSRTGASTKRSEGCLTSRMAFYRNPTRKRGTTPSPSLTRRVTMKSHSLCPISENPFGASYRRCVPLRPQVIRARQFRVAVGRTPRSP